MVYLSSLQIRLTITSIQIILFFCLIDYLLYFDIDIGGVNNFM